MGAAEPPQQRRPTCLLAAVSTAFLFSFFASAAVASSFRVTSAGDLRKYGEMRIPLPAAGPESVAFDATGGGPYTGVSDGRVLRWRPGTRLWEEFAVPRRRQSRSSWCNGNHGGEQQESACGRPLGLQFHRATGNLYIADAYFGLLVAGPGGGVATEVATAAEGQPFRFTNGVDIDQHNGVVYFTDSSTVFQRRDFLMCVITGDATGRLLRYDPASKRPPAVLLRGLAFPNGVAVSRDGAFLVVAETSRCRLLRYWLRGPRAGASEVFAELPGYPDNIKWSRPGGDELWAALNMGTLGAAAPAAAACPVAARVAADGRVVEVVNDCGSVGEVSEVAERNGTLWFGSVVRSSLVAYYAR